MKNKKGMISRIMDFFDNKLKEKAKQGNCCCSKEQSTEGDLKCCKE